MERNRKNGISSKMSGKTMDHNRQWERENGSFVASEGEERASKASECKVSLVFCVHHAMAVAASVVLLA